MELYVLSCITIASIICQNAFARNLPTYVSVCNRDSPQLSQCFKENLQNLAPHLAGGISEFQIPPVSKLVIPLIKLGHIVTSNVNVNTSLENVKFGGLEKYDVVDAKINLEEDPFLSYQLHFDELLVEFVNKAKGRVLATTLDGKANITAKNKDVSVTCEWEGERYSQDGREHLKFKIKNQSSVLSHIEIDMRGFFKDDPEMEAAFNRMFNDNTVALRPGVQSFVAKVVCETLTTYQNQVFSLFDLEELFPAN